MTFRERYFKSETWHEKALVMEIYHLAMRQRTNHIQTVSDTAKYFGVSIGLVSENLRLAEAIHKNPNLIQSNNRQEALKNLNGHGYFCKKCNEYFKYPYYCHHKYNPEAPALKGDK